MADTGSLVKHVYPYILKEICRIINTELKEQKLFIGNPKREKKFDGVSEDRNTILSIFTSSGYSKSGKLPIG